MREQAARSRKLDMEQRRSEETVQRRLQEMKARRHGAATEVLSTHAKQRTTLEQAKKVDILSYIIESSAFFSGVKWYTVVNFIVQ